MANTFDHVADIEIVEGAETLVRREKLINRLAGVMQFLMWPVLFPLFHIFFTVNIHGRENFAKIKNPFIILANHINFYDSFLFRIALGCFSPHLPLRFMAVRIFEKRYLNIMASIGLVDFIYSLFGVFTIEPGKGIHANLREAREIIRVGGNIVIYPEGRIVDEPGIGIFKKGAAVLMQKTGAPIIPVSFRSKAGSLFRRKIMINIGAPIQVSYHMSTKELTESFHQTIESLYESES